MKFVSAITGYGFQLKELSVLWGGVQLKTFLCCIMGQGTMKKLFVYIIMGWGTVENAVCTVLYYGVSAEGVL